jgi:hypothetical protein
MDKADAEFKDVMIRYINKQLDNIGFSIDRESAVAIIYELSLSASIWGCLPQSCCIDSIIKLIMGFVSQERIKSTLFALHSINKSTRKDL